MRDQVRTSYRISSVAMVSKAIGGVAPIGWLSAATVLIDQALNDYQVVWAAAGHPHAVYPTTFTELLECTGARPMVVGD
jgi:prolyl-tRNA editing enzyme YbaK/EbsC (Cys-tRNA(Pro) deacylase)